MKVARTWLWTGALVLTVALLLPFRGRLDKAHVTLALLLVVLSAAAEGGRRAGLVTALLAFLAFDWFFLPPFSTFVIADPLDWFVLFAFLGTSVIASHLFHRVQREAAAARERTDDVTTLATLGAQAMAAPRAQGALHVVAETTRAALSVASCRVHVLAERAERASGAAAAGAGSGAGDSPPAPIQTVAAAEPGDASDLPSPLEPVRLVLDRTTPVAVLADGVVRVVTDGERALVPALAGTDVRRLLLPLRRGADAIGVLDLQGRAPIHLDEARQRLLLALAYYAALGAERTRLERAAEHLEVLREADQMRNAVLASVSHDLRTPLTTIKVLAHELGSLGDERSEVIEQEADRLNRFVGDMLDLSRLASGRVALQVTVTPVEELITGALQQVEGSFGARRIDVTLPRGDALPLARFDLTHSVRILVNLLENARKYAPGDAPVELRVEPEGSMQAIHVADRGPGIPPEEAGRIFEPLYRPASARVDQGSVGLGLSIARGLAEAQGGSLTCAPRAGGGSDFVLRLPAATLDDTEVR